MNRIEPVDTANASDRTKELIEATRAQLGRVPNLYLAMARSTTALDGYLQFRGALVNGTLAPAMQESIALLTAASNDCDYCVAAHCFRASKLGLDEAELQAVQALEVDDPRSRAALKFVATLIERRGQVTDADLAAVRALGWSDEEIGEIVAHVALNTFSNYFNHVAEPVLDFPEV